MSASYVRSLVRLKTEYEAVDASLRYVQEQWRRQNLPLSITLATPEALSRAISDLPSAYSIRLFSTFEGMLREHMAQHHTALSEDTPAIQLIDRVASLEDNRVSAQLRDKVHEVRRYRNFLVHAGGTLPLIVAFPDALARLSKFVDKLPEPH